MSPLGSALGLGLVLLVQSCASSMAGSSEKRVATGTWGGEHVGLSVTETGAHIEFDCAHGDIGQPLALDSAGKLSVDGVFVREHGGPVIEGQEEKKPARYTGKVDGKTMTLDVTLTDSREKIGAFTLTYRASPRIVKCL